MTYHFKIHDGKIPWAECVELEGCVTQGESGGELAKNMREALGLYLMEPEGSKVIFPLPRPKIRGAGIVAVEVEPSVAFSVQLRQLRLRSGLTQAEAARRLGMNSLYSYQRLERRPNPSLSMMKNVKRVFPELSVDLALGE